MGECRNDYGGYFIIDGKEKVIVSQEKFADNMLYIKENKPDDVYSHSAEIRSVSEDTSKAVRTTAIKIVSPSPTLSNNQIVVAVPNVRKPVPLFILRALNGAIFKVSSPLVYNCHILVWYQSSLAITSSTHKSIRSFIIS